ncbi:hypothetical protein [Streptomyces echinatus]|uniref:Uncharacterized protein n=1 Tax=Streptomyces echinatus TaxID=67293 RepID=A0A7W9UWJ3_9ACTN|nr:hypothetical protein [Streptomyces echinatus]MBB5932744.1 hypothetical protein [Streptomyces echinatus]
MTLRLILSYLALALLVLLGLEIPLGYLYARGEESRFSQSVERDASMLAEVAEENIEKGNLTALPAMGREYAEANTSARVVIVDRTGQLLTDSADATATGTTLAGDPDIAAALRNQTTVTTRTGTDGTDVLAATPAPPSAAPCR